MIVEERLEGIVERLHAEGYRLTPQRVAIVGAVLDGPDHPAVEQIYERVCADFPMLSLATVYKTLDVLEGLGVVQELQVGGVRHYDGDVTPHAHAACVECERIFDLPGDAGTMYPADRLEEMGFRALRCEITVYGLCPQCQAGKEET